MSEVSDLDSIKLTLRKNGDLTVTEDGQQVVVAHYEPKTGHLEFMTKEGSARYYNQAVTRIGTVAKGTQVSSMVVRSMGVKGDTPKKIDPKAPKKPKLGRLGDAAEDYVAWMLKYDLPQAIIRYGIYVDENGDPIKKRVRRIVEHSVDNRNLEDAQIQPVREGPNTQSKGPVTRENELVDGDGEPQIIARRATALTFTPQEVVGGYQPEDDFEDNNAGEQENE